MRSKKTSGADNQQERLRFIGWITGFVDGEGCFTISFFKHPKSRLRLKWQVFPEFVITQGMRTKGAIKKVKKYFGCGEIYLNKRHDNHHEHLIKYVVRSREDLLTRIIPFFKRYPLLSAKRKDFRIFAKVIKMMNKGEHLKKNGLGRIRLMVREMNNRKFR